VIAYASSEGPSLPCTVPLSGSIESCSPSRFPAGSWSRSPSWVRVARQLKGVVPEVTQELRPTRGEGDSLRFERGAVASLHGVLLCRGVQFG
jgi:hypothetical protein